MGSRGGEVRLGRPPRVTRAEIADAALAIGLEHATIRNVAERLGMSVPGLYHHVRTREELLALAAAHSMGELPLPADHGQPWEEWLLEYGRFVYGALVAQPELVGQTMAGTYNTVRMAQHLEGVFSLLVSRGFTVQEAEAARRQLFGAVIGAAVSEISRKAAGEAGHRPLDDLRRAAGALGPESVPLVHRWLEGDGAAGDQHAFDHVRLTVRALQHERSRSAGRKGASA